MRFILFFTFYSLSSLKAQIGINTTSPNASSILDVNSTSKALLVPRLTNSQMNAISSPATGLTIYNTDATSLYVYNGLTWNSKEDRISGFVDDGVSMQLDNLKVQLSTNTSERSAQIATVSGSINISGSCVNIYPNGTLSNGSGGTSGLFSAWTRQTDVMTTSFTTFHTGLNFGQHGSTQTIEIIDETNNHAYSIILIVGNTYKSNFLSLKRKY